jgi:branched-chain amino acid transport system substrate-binding protein
MRRTLSLNITAALAAAAFAASTAFGFAPRPAAAATVIKIGIDLPVSGADASIGIPTQNGALLAIEEANAKHVLGAGTTLQAYALDDAVQGKHDPAQGAQNVKTFIADPSVLAMIGPFNSNVAVAEIPLTNDAGLVQISASTTNDALTRPPNAAKLRSTHPETNAFFRVCTVDSRQGAAGAQFARKLGFKRAFIVDDNETYGKGLADVFDAQFKALGGAVVDHEHITSNQQDFKALLTKARSMTPDVVFYGGTTSTGGGLVRKQMADVGLKGVAYMGGDGIGDDEFLKVAGTMANGTYYSIAAPEATRLPTAGAFVAAYKKRFNAEVGPYSANAYAAAEIEIAAIAKAMKADGGKVPTRAQVLKNVAATNDFETPIGKIGFDKYGDTTSPILSLYEVKGEKKVFVNQISLKTS